MFATKGRRGAGLALVAQAAPLVSLALGCASAPPAVSPPAPAFEPFTLPLSFERGLPIVELEVGGQRLELVVDTGADRDSVAIKPASMAGIEMVVGDRERKSLDITGTARVAREYVFPEARLGPLSLADVAGSDELRDFVPRDGILGNRFLSRFVLLLDYRASTMTVYPAGAEPAELASGTWAEARLSRGLGGILVRCSWEGARERSFCLDTGAGSGLVDSRLFRAKGGREGTGDGGARGGARLRDFRVAGRAFGDQDFTTMNLGVLTPFGRPFAGIVGYNILRDRRTVIDLGRMRAYFEM